METVVKRKRRKRSKTHLKQPMSPVGGQVRFVLDEGNEVMVDGDVYGLTSSVAGTGFMARIYFDHFSRRLRVLDYKVEDHAAMVERIAWLAGANGAGKSFIKAHQPDYETFVALGYGLEGCIPGYFQGETDAYVVSHFFDSVRSVSRDLDGANEIIESLKPGRKPMEKLPPLPEEVTIEPADKDDIPALVSIYERTFQTYPTPLTNPDYLLSCLEGDVAFRVARHQGEIMAVASADMDIHRRNAEMTDCATLPEARGKGLMKHILTALEGDLEEQGCCTAYTLCRAINPGINHVFHGLGYEYTGRMINNCHIDGQFEDMNIWTKQLEI